MGQVRSKNLHNFGVAVRRITGMLVALTIVVVFSAALSFGQAITNRPKPSALPLCVESLRFHLEETDP